MVASASRGHQVEGAKGHFLLPSDGPCGRVEPAVPIARAFVSKSCSPNNRIAQYPASLGSKLNGDVDVLGLLMIQLKWAAFS